MNNAQSNVANEEDLRPDDLRSFEEVFLEGVQQELAKDQNTTLLTKERYDLIIKTLQDAKKCRISHIGSQGNSPLPAVVTSFFTTAGNGEFFSPLLALVKSGSPLPELVNFPYGVQHTLYTLER